MGDYLAAAPAAEPLRILYSTDVAHHNVYKYEEISRSLILCASYLCQRAEVSLSAINWPPRPTAAAALRSARHSRARSAVAGN